MKHYRVRMLYEEVFEILAKNKHEAELRVLEGLSDEERGTVEIHVEEIKNEIKNR